MTTQAATKHWPNVDDVAEDIRALLDRSRHVVCLAHKDADADSLGSALAFALSLRAQGKTVHPVVPAPWPFLLSYLPGFDTLEESPAEYDCVLTFDCATTHRFGDKRPMLESGVPVVNVDHHVSNDGYGAINLIEPEASATGQVVYRLLRKLDMPVTPQVADNLYAALFTDTGGFRHENTTEAALRLGAELVHLGADPAFIALKSYKSRPVPMLKLEGLAVAALRTDCDGTLVWSQVTQEMLETSGATMVESEGVIDQLQSIDTMKIAVLFKQMSPELTKISVRTRDEIDATDLCIPFGGGGHHRAAGAELPMSLEKAQATVLPMARELLSHTA
ncbi:MAG TPA: DHH family phosphoesterase [Candidatus Dormibacteraeota bacterium]|nr:DHH family phosphoesterase [Candidatus Dormibacteraeota bacterium]